MKPAYYKIIILAGIISLACTTRVSEWVLLNSLPNQYTLIYFHNSPLNETFKKQNLTIADRIKTANIQFKTVTRQDIKEPYYGLYYEDRLFSRYNNPDEFRNLTTSPLREKIAAELMAGKLCVMVYLMTDDKEKDEKGLQALKKALGASPFGKIITVFELSRNSKEEALFASLLLNVEDDLKGIQEPMLFGVFGRFKALEPLLGRGISEENINLMIDYLTAECSCLIKDDLPGTDILFTDKWDNPQPALLNKIIDENLSLGN
ncbi:MAG: hypothetical protein Q7T72_03235 [Bacteroidales bacterium]|nr:hypothetical protein [Bacteroidales bacterium]MDP3003119.1 hypothetical protein [Bacteroidales bacterium]